MASVPASQPAKVGMSWLAGWPAGWQAGLADWPFLEIGIPVYRDSQYMAIRDFLSDRSKSERSEFDRSRFAQDSLKYRSIVAWSDHDLYISIYGLWKRD